MRIAECGMAGELRDGRVVRSPRSAVQGSRFEVDDPKSGVKDSRCCGSRFGVQVPGSEVRGPKSTESRESRAVSREGSESRGKRGNGDGERGRIGSGEGAEHRRTGETAEYLWNK